MANRPLEEAPDEERELSVHLAPAEVKARVVLRFVCEGCYDVLDGAPVPVHGGQPLTAARVIEAAGRNYRLDERRLAVAVCAFPDRLGRAGILADRGGDHTCRPCPRY